MCDEPENQNLIETFGDKVGESLPERLQTEKVAYGLGSVLGFISGFVFGRAVVRQSILQR